MPQSLAKNYVHITFSTKNRYAFFENDFQKELFSYLAGACHNMESFPLIVGGHKDHIHILCNLSRKIALMKFMEEIKTHSSKWIKTKGNLLSNFYWQNGYGAFSVNPTEVDIVIDYIKNQERHHLKRTFQDEYRAFLKKYNIDYDERFVWD